MALTRSERHVAYYYDKPDTSTFRYRVFNMVEALNSAPRLGISASWFCRVDLPRLDKFIERADVLVICRTHYFPGISRLIACARSRGLHVIYDVDDLIFDPDYTHLLVDTLDQLTEGDEVWDHWFGRVGRLGATLRLCDSVIVTNPWLAERASAYAPHVSTRIVPNFLNRQQQALSENLWTAKRDSGFERNGKIHVGYFSGTPTHNRDFEIAAGALTKLLEEDARIVIRMVGFLKPQGPLLRHLDRIEVYPLQDFLNLQRLVAQVEINIAPLQNNAFTNCKSELKYFEAAIVGTLTLASPSFTFRDVIRDGENGMLANSQEWYPKLCSAVQVVLDVPQYAAMAESAFREVQERYNWSRYADVIASAVFGQRSSHAPLADALAGGTAQPS